MDRIKIEICCGSAEDVHKAAKAGAHRAELSSCLYFGGLTPSAAQVKIACEAGIPVIAMARCREGGFLYSRDEINIMACDAEIMRGLGAAGIVFGGITEEGLPDIRLCESICSACGSGDKVFHKAFDLMEKNWKKSLDILINHGITRVLTSGFRKSAMEGAENIAAMREYVQGAIEILPGGGIRENNLREIAEKTGCTWLHSSAGREYAEGGEKFFSEDVSFSPSSLPGRGADGLVYEAAEALMRKAGKI